MNNADTTYRWSVDECGRSVYDCPLSNTSEGYGWGELEPVQANGQRGWRWYWMHADGTVEERGWRQSFNEATRYIEARAAGLYADEPIDN